MSFDKLTGTLTVSGLDAALNQTTSLKNVDLTKPMRTASLLMRDQLIDGFRSESDPWHHPWPALAVPTLKARKSRGNTSMQTLVDTARMFDSIDDRSGPDFAEVSIGADLPDDRARFNQDGTARVPSRKMLPISGPSAAESIDPESLPPGYLEKVTQPIVDALVKAGGD